MFFLFFINKNNLRGIKKHQTFSITPRYGIIGMDFFYLTYFILVK